MFTENTFCKSSKNVKLPVTGNKIKSKTENI